jgi:hypothetical protein
MLISYYYYHRLGQERSKHLLSAADNTAFGMSLSPAGFQLQGKVCGDAISYC